MKIEAVKTYIVNQKLNEQSFSYSQAWYNSRTIMLLEIVTDDGISGWGEAFGNAFINKAVIENVYAPAVKGENIFDSEKIWDNLYNNLRDNGQKGSAIEALSAVDNALWDLKGKYAHLPVYRLLGGSRRQRVMPYATGLYHSCSASLEKDLINEAVSYVNQGFKAIKMKIGFGILNDVAMVKNIRREIGGDILLMVDANHAYNASSAVQLARGIEQYNIAWLEEPVPPEDIEGYKELKTKTVIPIAGGEAEYTRYGFNRLLGARAVDIVQPDCCVTGGLSEFLKIVTLAKINNIQCYPHIWGSAVALQVGINAVFALPDFPESLNPADVFLELDCTPNVFREKLSKNRYEIKDGYIDIPKFDGLGLDIDREIIRNYSV